MSDVHRYMQLERFSKFVEGHGKVVDGDHIVEAYQTILANLESIPLGGDARVILNCRGVRLIMPSLLSMMVIKLESEETPQRTFCHHRSLVIMNANPDTELLLTWMLKGRSCSLLMIYTDSQQQGKVIRENILNLPHFLRETLDVIAEHRSLSSHQVIGLLKKDKNP